MLGLIIHAGCVDGCAISAILGISVEFPVGSLLGALVGVMFGISS